MNLTECVGLARNLGRIDGILNLILSSKDRFIQDKSREASGIIKSIYIDIKDSLKIESCGGVLDTCDQGHKFLKMEDHPIKDKIARCPYCMAQGLDLERQAVALLEKKLRANRIGKALDGK